MAFKGILNLAKQMLGGDTTEVKNISLHGQYLDNNAVGGALEADADAETIFEHTTQAREREYIAGLELSYQNWQDAISAKRVSRSKRQEQIRSVKQGPILIALLDDESEKLSGLFASGKFKDASELLNKINKRYLNDKQRRISQGSK